MANSVDPDETAHDEPSHLDLHFLQKESVLAYKVEMVKFYHTYPKIKTIDILKEWPFRAMKTLTKLTTVQLSSFYDQTS